MKNQERKQARRYDTPYRCRELTAGVYSGYAGDRQKRIEETFAHEKEFYPEKSRYHIYFGDIHGHSSLSDGSPDIDAYYKDIRDREKLDFCALTDHDHGGVGRSELFGEKWELTKQKAAEYYEPGRFTTILGYERDSYPWYNNLVVYFAGHDGEMLRGAVDGEITREELLAALRREDLLLVPHDTYNLTAGADLGTIPPELFTPLIEIYSRGDSAEYFGNPCNTEVFRCEGGFWQDALKRGARMGCIAASDDHFRGVKDFPNYSGIDVFAGKTAGGCFWRAEGQALLWLYGRKGMDRLSDQRPLYGGGIYGQQGSFPVYQSGGGRSGQNHHGGKKLPELYRNQADRADDLRLPGGAGDGSLLSTGRTGGRTPCLDEPDLDHGR